ncbi:DMT family transporter [Afifella sp. IM 167]|uniref:DMT family transporter n=1 Tax=Afifella sp. IM 167 TaxID=2033586 RepID=UPI001CCCDBD1|nr:DMT family transporter [Afifella sp. IM 167]MBZ8132468.1 EamA family transporter [Afifella sp. IM 167]
MSVSAGRLRDAALLAVMPLFFCSNLVIGRAAVTEVAPWSLAFFRWLGAFLILLPFAWQGLRRHRRQLREVIGLVFLLGFLGMWVCGAMVYFALQHTNATNATLIYTSAGVMILLLEWMFRGRALTFRRVVGVIMAFLGVATIVLRGELARLITLDFNGGDLLIALCAFSWAVYSVLLKRPSLDGLPTISLIAAISAAGSVALLPFALGEMIVLHAVPTGASAWLTIAGLALLPSVLAFASYQWAVARFGPGVPGMFLYLMPPYGVGLAILFLGEEFHLYHAAGLLLVLPGLMLATLPSRPTRFARRDGAGEAGKSRGGKAGRAGETA